MLATIVLVSIALAWLGRETDWLRIRLPVGATYVPPEYRRISWEDLRPYRISEKYQPFWLKHPDNMQPLCGWDYLKNTMHVIPETKVELYFGNGYRQTFTLKKPELMKQIIKINTGKKYFKELALAH